MTDYIWTIGTGDQMMVRDNGTVVEFFFHSDTSTFNSDQDFAFTINGHTVTGSFNLPADGAWHRVGYESVYSDQTVSFTIYGSGLGWATTTHTADINRSTVPPAPDAVVLTNVTHNSLHAEFTGNGNGGLPITEWQIGYGTSPTTAQFTRTGFDVDITGLATDTIYYFWARGANALGWGPWGPRSAVRTDSVPPAPQAVVLTNIKQNSLHAEFVSNGNGGATVVEWQIGYGLSSTAPTATISSFDTDITNLDPGKTYYFWARGRNAVGWSAYSPRSQATLIAGAMVNVGGVWKRAVPYVRVAGVWKLARPWVRSAGVWKETSA